MSDSLYNLFYRGSVNMLVLDLGNLKVRSKKVGEKDMVIMNISVMSISNKH